MPRHVDSLRQYNPEEIGDNEYQISCHLPTAVVEVIIKLPENFPDARPIIRTVPEMIHPWFINGVLESDSIKKWNKKSSLGYVMEELVTEFTMRPPKAQSDPELRDSLKKFHLETAQYFFIKKTTRY